jgi:hypothetical protein
MTKRVGRDAARGVVGATILSGAWSFTANTATPLQRTHLNADVSASVADAAVFAPIIDDVERTLEVRAVYLALRA